MLAAEIRLVWAADISWLYVLADTLRELIRIRKYADWWTIVQRNGKFIGEI